MSTDCNITKDTRISDAIRMCPGAADVFARHGMGCMACLASSAETVEEGANMHGVDSQTLVDELNASCGEAEC